MPFRLRSGPTTWRSASTPGTWGSRRAERPPARRSTRRARRGPGARRPRPRARVRRSCRTHTRLQHGVLEARLDRDRGLRSRLQGGRRRRRWCWKVLDRDWKIGFHPAALVWHRRRPGLRAYLRQQRGYGHSEALVEAPPRSVHGARSARWRGRIYNVHAPRLTLQRVYRGLYGTAAYQSIYQAGGHALDLLHQVGIPVAALVVPTGLLGLIAPPLAIPAAIGLTFILGARGSSTPSEPDHLAHRRRGRFRFRAGVALHHVLQPLARWWARVRGRNAPPAIARAPELPQIVERSGTAVVVPEDRPRAELRASCRRVARIRVQGPPPNGWEDYDARPCSAPSATATFRRAVIPRAPFGCATGSRPRRRLPGGPAPASRAARHACCPPSGGRARRERTGAAVRARRLRLGLMSEGRGATTATIRTTKPPRGDARGALLQGRPSPRLQAPAAHLALSGAVPEAGDPLGRRYGASRPWRWPILAGGFRGRQRHRQEGGARMGRHLRQRHRVDRVRRGGPPGPDVALRRHHDPERVSHDEGRSADGPRLTQRDVPARAEPLARVPRHPAPRDDHVPDQQPGDRVG